ncbi:MAG: AAA family ATPase [Pirellulales bacterium]|nr:AAA family ATPase [Pirellulales bacterium]
MKINAIQVDGFGVWSDLRLGELPEGLSVFCGPNEAGKTTLMQFIRSMLYGFTPERRRYLPPPRGGRPGGALDLAGPDGSVRLVRHDDLRAADGQARAILVASDGTRHGDELLAALLSGVDEATFNNVFAVGLRELQALGVLGDTEAASLLFNLSVGLDRVSLVEVIRETELSRLRLLRDDGKPCRIGQLADQRARLLAELEELDAQTDAYTRLWDERQRLDRDVARLEEEKQSLQQQARELELAVSLRPKWHDRAALDAQLASSGAAGAIPAGGLGRLARLVGRAKRYRLRLKETTRRHRETRRQAEAISVNEALCRQAARIEAMREQEGWMLSLGQRTAQLRDEIARNEEELAAQRRQLGLRDAPILGETAAPARRATSRMRQSAEQIERLRASLVEARQQSEAAAESARSLAAELNGELAARGEKDLAAALDRAGNLANQLRRREQLDERLAQMDHNTADLDHQSRDLLGRQIMPLWMVAGLGLLFVFGVVALMAGLFAPASIVGTTGWPLVLVGLAGVGLAAGGKVAIERSHARRIDACQKQIHLLQRQTEQAREERRQLDDQLREAGQVGADRLAQAEAVLKSLESLVPLRSRHEAARREADAAAARLAQAEEASSAARRRWREALAAAGLPEDLSVKQVRRWRRSSARRGELAARLARDRDELAQRQAELDGLRERLVAVATEAQVDVADGGPIELVRRLADEVRRHEEQRRTRDRLDHEARQLRRQRVEAKAALRRALRRRRALLARWGVADEDDLRRRADESARLDALRQRRDALDAEIRAALGGRATEQAMAGILDGATDADLEARWVEADRRLAAIAERFKQQYEVRGRLAEQLKALADDRRQAAKRMELATVEKRLDDAVRRWQILAITGRVLREIKELYERERQPEALQEASGYLRRLTTGRYARVWTPLDEDVLRVDDARGQSVSVEALSRGTREQLFLALRLALVSTYARRGARLPVVLDDVLVNYDAPRAKAAAEVLCDFAQSGHQVLLFTCHDHIHRLFRSLKVEARLLPENDRPSAAAPPADAPSDALVRRAKKVKRVKKKRRRESVPEEPLDESDGEAGARDSGLGTRG